MIRVVLESPYAGDVERNTLYARACMKDSLMRGEAPIASHLLYTQVLNDLDADERNMGIDAGLSWLGVADKHVFYIDYGYSEGMKKALARSQQIGFVTEERLLGEHWCETEKCEVDYSFSGIVKVLQGDNALGRQMIIDAIKEYFEFHKLVNKHHDMCASFVHKKRRRYEGIRNIMQHLKLNYPLVIVDGDKAYEIDSDVIVEKSNVL